MVITESKVPIPICLLLYYSRLLVGGRRPPVVVLQKYRERERDHWTAMTRSSSAKGRDPSGVYDPEEQAAPTPTHRPAAAGAARDANNDRQEGPSFKDQARSVTNGQVNGSSNGSTETSAVAVASAARSKSRASKSSTGPSFKDQVRPVSDGVVAEPLKEEEATDKQGPLDNIGPAFKDQVRHEPQQQQKSMVRRPPPPASNNNSQNDNAPSVVFADAQLMDSPNNGIIDDNVLPAQVLPGMNAHVLGEQPQLQPNAETEGEKSKKTVVIAVVAIVLLAVAAIVGGVCGSGACGGGDDESISSPKVRVKMMFLPFLQ